MFGSGKAVAILRYLAALDRTDGYAAASGRRGRAREAEQLNASASRLSAVGPDQNDSSRGGDGPKQTTAG